MRMQLNPAQRRRNLVVVCAGDGSLHREWLEPPEERNFDLCICYYGEETGKYEQDGSYYLEAKGEKFAVLHELIEEHGTTILKYDAIWLPDEEIRTNALVINRLFDLFHEHKLQLAQPALTKNAYFQVTARHIDYKLRFTRFVERLAPVFSREALRICWPTFHDEAPVLELESAWANLLGYPAKGMAILDAAPVQYARPREDAGQLLRDLLLLFGQELDEDCEAPILEEYGMLLPNQANMTFHDGIRLWQPTLPPAARKPREATRETARKPALQSGRNGITRTAKSAPPWRPAGKAKRN